MVNEALARFSTFKQYFKQVQLTRQKVYAVASILLIIILSLIGYRFVIYKTEISEFSLKASMSDASGVAQKSHFILIASTPLSAQVIEKYVKINPATEFQVNKVSDLENTYEIVPLEELKPEQIYTVTIDKGPLATHDFSWAYQIKAPFQVTSSIPGNKGVDVPLNTGIEIYFNRDDIISPGDFIEISPKVDGLFTMSENKVTFIPSKPLEPKSIYTIIIKNGLQAKGTTDTLLEDVVIQFQTQQGSSNDSPSFTFSRLFNEFKPGASVALGISAYGVGKLKNTVAVYQFDSADEFLNAVSKVKGDTPWARYYSNIDSPLANSKKVFSGSVPLEVSDDLSVLRLPQTYAVGYYAVVLTIGKNKDIAWFQVNPAASFAVFSGEKSLLWLKDIESGESIKGATVQFSNKTLGTTGGDGVVLFKTPEELLDKQSRDSYSYYGDTNRKFFVAKVPQVDLVIPVENEYGYSDTLSRPDLWWNYISLNKVVYLPDDTVRFWAIQKPRVGENSDEEISVTLTNPYWFEEDEKDAVVYAQTKLKISDFNALTGELSFTHLRPGLYELTFRNSMGIIGKQTVTVGTYIKPAYFVRVTSDKSSVFAGSPITYTVKASFFDNTPFAYGKFSYTGYTGYSGDSEIKGDVTLNAEGVGTFTVIPPYTEVPTYWPSVVNVVVKPKSAEEGEISGSATVFVFGPHINNEITQKLSATDASFSVKTRYVVMKSNLDGALYWDQQQYLGGPVEGITTIVDVVEVEYIQKQVGTDYDPINKVTSPIYSYTSVDHQITSQSIVSDHNGVATFSYPTKAKQVYKFIFTTYDSVGRIEKKTQYVYGGEGSYYGLRSTEYSLHNNDADNEYKIGDSVSLQLQTSLGDAPQDGKEKFIFMTNHNGDLRYSIQDSPIYKSTFVKNDVPNISVWPGWFSEGRFRNSYAENLTFEANERRLQIAVTKDKETYKPGDKVKLDIKVTDKDGNPVKAEINISALDEAVFSVRPEETDIVSELYRDIYSQMVIRTSNTPPYGGGGAEKGGGGDDGMLRSNLEEMAIYKSVTSDTYGNAHVEFTLPDSITSWRLTSQAVTKDLYAGKNISFIPVTLPFFVDTTLNSSYLAGDQIMLRLRSFGTSMSGGDVTYSVESQTLPFKKREVTGHPMAEVSLGTLKSGAHDLTIKAGNGRFSDGLVRKIQVRDTYFTKDTSDLYDAVPGLHIKNDSVRHTTLTFGSYGRGAVYNQLKELGCQCGVRVDQKGSIIVASELLATYFGEKNDTTDIHISNYQSYDGGVKLLPYGSSELELSAIAAHLFGDEVFTQSSLSAYFRQALNDKKTDTSRAVLALYGLSAFKEPVLTKLEIIKDASGLSLKDTIYIALAFDSLGAKEEARQYYKKMIKPYVVTKTSYAYVDGFKGDDTIIMTTLVAALTASLEEPESPLLALYAEQKYPKETLSNFEKLLYLKNLLPTLQAGDVSFTYKVGTKEVTKTLKNGELFTIDLSPAELQTFKLDKVNGNVGIVASYEKTTSPETIVKDSNLKLARIYSVDNVSQKEFKEGDVVKVILMKEFAADALNGTYQVIDYAPSGLRPIVDQYQDTTHQAYIAEIDNQKVTFLIDKNSELGIYYYARVVTKGVYKAEPAVLQSLRSLDSMTLSNEDTITIK